MRKTSTTPQKMKRKKKFKSFFEGQAIAVVWVEACPLSIAKVAEKKRKEWKDHILHFAKFVAVDHLYSFTTQEVDRIDPNSEDGAKANARSLFETI